MAFICSSLAIQASEPLTLTDITGKTYNAQMVNGINPIAGTDEFARISDDGKRIEKFSFKTGELTGVLYQASDVAEDSKNDEGKELSIDDYVLSPDGKRLLLQTHTKAVYRRSFKADFYLYDTTDHSLKRLSEKGQEQVPTFSPDSKTIAYVHDNNIYLTDGNNTRQVTTDGKFNEVINGIPDWVNEEEFGFNNAMAWSADSRTLSWIRYDESRVKTYALQLFQGDKPRRKEFADYPGEYSYKYPKAGQENSRVTAWSYDVLTKTTRQLLVPLDDDGYLPRIKTMPQSSRRLPSRPSERGGGSEPSSIILYTLNRHQDVLRLYAVTPATGTCRLLIEEKGDRYVKEEAMEAIVITDRHILMPSDRDGYMHLYLYDLDGKLLKQVEKGNYDVTDVYGMDTKTGDIFFQAAVPAPMNRQVFVVGTNGKKKVLSCLPASSTGISDSQTGWGSAVFSADFQYYIAMWSDKEHPYVFSVFDRKGKHLRTICDNAELRAKLDKLALPKKEFFQFTTSEGVTLNGWMLKPADFDQAKRYPVVMHQYSGPGSQQVTDNWNIGSMGKGALFDQYMAQQGFVMVTVDGRGTGARGADFEKSTYLKLGDLESKDQVETALYLATLPFVDKDRIGIWGWSYGGFNTLMSMSEGRGVFRAGVAVAPPTNWKFYDTVYTERYMRTPQENASGYDCNPIQRAPQLHGDLLLCHGLADDNVHPQNSFEYTEALVQNDKDFRELIYTNRNHSIFGGNTRNHLLRQVAQFFITKLK